METKELKTGRDDFVRHSEISGDGIRSTVAGIAGGITSVVVSTMKLADLPRLEKPVEARKVVEALEAQLQKT